MRQKKYISPSLTLIMTLLLFQLVIFNLYIQLAPPLYYQFVTTKSPSTSKHNTTDFFLPPFFPLVPSAFPNSIFISHSNIFSIIIFWPQNHLPSQNLATIQTFFFQKNLKKSFPQFWFFLNFSLSPPYDLFLQQYFQK